MIEEPDQGGFGDQVRGDLREEDPARMSVGDIPSDLIDRGPFIVGQHRGRNNFLLFGVIISGIELHFLAHILIQELAGIQQVIFVILFQHLKLPGIFEGLDADTGGNDLGGHIPEFQFLRPPGQRELPQVLNQPQVAVVDRQLQGRLIRQGGGQFFNGPDWKGRQEKRQTE